MGTTNHLFYPVSSDIRNVVLSAGNVGLGFASSNITCLEHDISNVELPEVEQMYIVVPLSATLQSDWFSGVEQFLMFYPWLYDVKYEDNIPSNYLEK